MSSYRPDGAAGWRKSSFCGTGECVEAARRDGKVVLRDSKVPDGPILEYTFEEFRAFALGIQAGEFDDLFHP